MRFDRHQRLSLFVASVAMPKTTETSPELDHLWFSPTPGLGYWRAQVRCRGVSHAKGFPVLRHGSKEAALHAAQAWRDQLMQPMQPYSQQERVQRLRTNNTSGAPGVYRMKSTRLRSDGSVATYIHWEARTPEGAKPSRKKAFSILRHGEEQAYEMAIAARDAFVQSLGKTTDQASICDLAQPLKAQMQEPTPNGR